MLKISSNLITQRIVRKRNIFRNKKNLIANIIFKSNLPILLETNIKINSLNQSHDAKERNCNCIQRKRTLQIKSDVTDRLSRYDLCFLYCDSYILFIFPKLRERLSTVIQISFGEEFNICYNIWIMI